MTQPGRVNTGAKIVSVLAEAPEAASRGANGQSLVSTAFTMGASAIGARYGAAALAGFALTIGLPEFAAAGLYLAGAYAGPAATQLLAAELADWRNTHQAAAESLKQAAATTQPQPAAPTPTTTTLLPRTAEPEERIGVWHISEKDGRLVAFASAVSGSESGRMSGLNVECVDHKSIAYRPQKINNYVIPRALSVDMGDDMQTFQLTNERLTGPSATELGEALEQLKKWSKGSTTWSVNMTLGAWNEPTAEIRMDGYSEMMTEFLVRCLGRKSTAAAPVQTQPQPGHAAILDAMIAGDEQALKNALRSSLSGFACNAEGGDLICQNGSLTVKASLQGRTLATFSEYTARPERFPQGKVLAATLDRLGIAIGLTLNDIVACRNAQVSERIEKKNGYVSYCAQQTKFAITQLVLGIKRDTSF